MWPLDDPQDFRAWLASLPPSTPVNTRHTEVLMERYLRTFDPNAYLCGEDGKRRSDDWQCYALNGVRSELPSWAFFWGLEAGCECVTAGEALVSLDEYLTQQEAETLADMARLGAWEPWRWSCAPRDWKHAQDFVRSLARGVALAAGAGC